MSFRVVLHSYFPILTDVHSGSVQLEFPDGGELDPSRAIHPKAEAEIAFVLGKDWRHADTTAELVADAVATVHAAIEIVDSRIAGWKISFADTVADNGSSAFFVLGREAKRS